MTSAVCEAPERLTPFVAAEIEFESLLALVEEYPERVAAFAAILARRIRDPRHQRAAIRE